MISYNPQFHHRRSIRLKGYDYAQEGLYFITLCVQNRACLFGDIENRKMKLNDYGRIVENEWQKTTEIRKNIALHEYIIMPNHFHAILEIKNSIAGKSISSSAIDSANRTGESRFAPEINSSIQEGEYQFAPEINSIIQEGEYRFAPTENRFKSPSQTIGAIIRGFKGASTKRIKEFYLANRNNEESESSSEIAAKISTGELPFALKIDSSNNMGEYQFAPTEIDPANRTGEYRFALSDKIWQRNYYEHIIRDEQSYQRISEYIINNPAKWADDKFFSS